MTADDATDPSGSRVLVLGANGPTGRLVAQQALDRGLSVTAVTRHPESFPITDERLDVVGGDATDPATIDRAITGCDAVISAIGTAYTWKPVEVYSRSAHCVVDAMQRHGQRRLIVVTSMGAPKEIDQKGFVLTALQRVWRSTFTKTLYDDMLAMEQIVRTSGLDWTIVRPPGLGDDTGTGYAVAETRIDGPAMAREDLAALLLDQLTDREWFGRIVAAATPGLTLDPIKMIRKEVLKR